MHIYIYIAIAVTLYSINCGMKVSSQRSQYIHTYIHTYV